MEESEFKIISLTVLKQVANRECVRGEV